MTSATEPVGLEVPSREVWLVVAGLMLGTFPSALDTLVVITALPTIVGDLGGASGIAWVITAYLLTSTATAPLYGKLGDLIGRKRLYQIAIVIFAVGSVLCGLSRNLDQLIAARAFQGLGAGGLMALPMAILGDITTPRQRGRYQGVMSLNISLATIIGPLVGGFFVDHLSWRWVFFMNIPVTMIALGAALQLKVPVRRAAKIVIDVAGSLLIVATAACMLLVVTWAGSKYAWGSTTIVGLAALAAVLVVAAVICERRAVEPIMPPRLFRNRSFNIVSAGAFFLGAAMFGPWVLMPIFLQVVTGASATNSGLLLLPLIISLTITSMVVGRLLTRWGRYKVFTVVGIALAILGFSLYSTMGVDTSRATASLFMVATGIGLGMNLQVLVIIVQGTLEYRDLGVGTASVGFFQQLGGAFGTAVALSIYTSRFAANVKTMIPPAIRAGLKPSAIGGNPAAIRALPASSRAPLVEAFARALHDGFIWMIAPGVVAFFIMIFLKEAPLEDRVPWADDVGIATPVPTATPGPATAL